MKLPYPPSVRRAAIARALRPVHRNVQGIEPLEERCLLSLVVAPGFTDVDVGDGLTSPMSLAFAPDGKIFIAEKYGAVAVVDNGVLQSTPFVTLPTDDSGERGVSSVAVDPNYATNHYLYVYYNANVPTQHYRLSRFVVTGDTVDPSTETVLIDFPDTHGSEHMGGAMDFGPDGKLYIAVGDNGDQTTSQDLTNIWGKLLRVNADGTIPADNPFVSQTTGIEQAIYAIGLRNPFSMSVDPKTGNMFLGDVGGGQYEQVYQVQAGANYGWPIFISSPKAPGYVNAVYEYTHAVGQSITGGSFYDPPVDTFGASYLGGYFISDWAANWIQFLNLNTLTLTPFVAGTNGVLNIATGPDGALYYMDRGSAGATGQGSIHKIIPNTPAQVEVNVTLTTSIPGLQVGVGAQFFNAPYTLQALSGTQLAIAAPATQTVDGVTYDFGGWSQGGSASQNLTVPGSDTTYTALYSTVPTQVVGDGLLGSYFNNKTLTGTPAGTRVDPTINFSLAQGVSPGLGLGSANYSVRWTGQIQPAYSETYTFYLTSDDGSRLIINGQTLVDLWWDHDTITGKGTITLVAGQKYNIEVDYYQSGGAALGKLEWSSNSQARQVVPTADLFSDATGPNFTPLIAPTSLTDSVASSTEIDLSWSDNSTDETGFLIEMSTDNNTWTQAATAPASTGTGTVTFPVTGLTPSTPYYFRVRALRGATQSDPTNTVNAMTQAAPQTGGGDGLLATYFNNITLSGTPLITRVDPQINFSLNGTAPAAGLAATNYSVRWTGTVTAQYSQQYTFYLSGDDGVRLYINGNKVIDLWWDHDVIIGSASLALVAGQSYPITVEYYQHTGGAVAKLEWASASQPRQVIPTSALSSGTNGVTPVATPSNLTAKVISSTEIDLTWTNNAPDATGFLVETSPNGTDTWTQAGTTTATVFTLPVTSLTANTQYYYRVSALRGAVQSNPTAPLAATTFPNAGVVNGLTAAYYNNMTLSGTPVATRVDSTINFSLPSSPPVTGLGSTSWSAQWTGTIVPQFTEQYTFYLTSDDGSRLFINGQPLIDIWWDHDLITGKATINLVAGQSYNITVQYYQHTGAAVGKLEWSSNSQPREVVPSTALFSS